jgi:dTDP-4-dehydrorhamnose 3,5-epimerase
MIFSRATIDPVCLIDIEPQEDERGFFARTFSADEFARCSLPAHFAQCSVSFNRRRGTLRGMHYQAEPHSEGKLVRCTRGAVFDVVLDLRPDSGTYCQWLGVELSSSNRRAIYVPPGFAHGIQTLVDETEVFYQITEPYHAESARGVRWNDPLFAIHWPLPDPVVSQRDINFPDFSR